MREGDTISLNLIFLWCKEYLIPEVFNKDEHNNCETGSNINPVTVVQILTG